MKHFKIIGINLLVLLVFCVLLEGITRWLAPDYANAYFTTNITRGHPIFLNKIWGHRVQEDQVDSSLQPKDDNYRVLFIGDSVTFGYGVNYSDTYHEVAGRTMAAQNCNTFIHGVGRYYTNLTQLMNSEFRNFILEGYGANMIVYQFNVNDLDSPGPPKKTNETSLTLREHFEKFRITYLNRSTFLKWLQSSALKLYERSKNRNLTDSLRYSPTSNPELYKNSWEDFEETLIEVSNNAKKQGIEFSVILIPESYQVSQLNIDNDMMVDFTGIESWPNEKVIEITNRHGIPAFDTLKSLQDYRRDHPGTRLYFPNDQNHPNATGHVVIGDAVAAYLSKNIDSSSCSSEEAR